MSAISSNQPKRDAPEGELSTPKRQRTNSDHRDHEVGTLAVASFLERAPDAPPPPSSSSGYSPVLIDRRITREYPDSHDPEALHKLGIDLLTGAGIKKDTKKGFELLKQAAEQLHVPALFELAECYSNGRFGIETNGAIGRYYFFLGEINEMMPEISTDEYGNFTVPEFGNYEFKKNDFFFNPFLPSSEVKCNMGYPYGFGMRDVHTPCEGLIIIAGALSLNIPMKSLDLSYHSIDEECAVELGDALAINSTLTELFLRDTSKNCMHLVDALRLNSTISYLALEDRAINDEYAKTISEVLRVNSSLTDLNINNTMGDDEVTLIAGGLTFNSSLATLDLGTNDIGDMGATAIALALTSNSTLTTLVLSVSNIGCDGAMAIAGALKVNSTLIRLDLSDNKIENDGAMAIGEALKVNSTLTHLDLSRNRIQSDITFRMLQPLDRNRHNRIQKEITLFGALFSPVLEGPIYNFQKV